MAASSTMLRWKEHEKTSTGHLCTVLDALLRLLLPMLLAGPQTWRKRLGSRRGVSRRAVQKAWLHCVGASVPTTSANGPSIFGSGLVGRIPLAIQQDLL